MLKHLYCCCWIHLPGCSPCSHLETLAPPINALLYRCIALCFSWLAGCRSNDLQPLIVNNMIFLGNLMMRRQISRLHNSRCSMHRTSVVYAVPQRLSCDDHIAHLTQSRTSSPPDGASNLAQLCVSCIIHLARASTTLSFVHNSAYCLSDQFGSKANIWQPQDSHDECSQAGCTATPKAPVGTCQSILTIQCPPEIATP